MKVLVASKVWLLCSILLFSLSSASTPQEDMYVQQVSENSIIGSKGGSEGIKIGEIFFIQNLGDSQIDIIGKAKVVILRKNICGLKVVELRRGAKINVGYILTRQVPSNAVSRGFKATFPWKTKEYTKPHLVGITMELGGIFPYRNTGGVLRFNAGIPYIYKKTIAIEAAIGIDVFFPPTTPYDPPLIEPDNENFGRIMKSIAAYYIPIAFRFTARNRWVYPFLGLRAVWLTGVGKTSDALDHLYSSNLVQNYEVDMNLFLSLGFAKSPYFIRMDVLLTDNKGKFIEAAHDPYGVGPSYYLEKGPFNEPKFFLTIGVLGIFGKHNNSSISETSRSRNDGV